MRRQAPEPSVVRTVAGSAEPQPGEKRPNHARARSLPKVRRGAGFGGRSRWQASCVTGLAWEPGHMSQPDQRTRSVADEVARYLERCPDASDTEEGVMQWWIPRIRIDEELAVVRDALTLLVAEGTVERRILPGGSVLVRRMPCGD